MSQQKVRMMDVSKGQKQEMDAENLFEAEVEYVLDRLQQKAHAMLGDEAGTISDCIVEINSRLAGISSNPFDRRYWLHDLGVIALQIMTVMESNGYKLSEEILEIMAQAREEHRGLTATKRLAS